MIIAVTEVNGRIIYVNDLFCKISKYRKDELIGKTHRVVRSGYHDKLFFQKNVGNHFTREYMGR